ncbi:MAG: PilZ domain-containing protein [Terriglobia bacterium]|jgi:hypothetical protein
MTIANQDRRRSDRLWLTIPLRIEGVNPDGRPFDHEGRAVGLNRHGARVQTSEALERGQAVRLKSPMGGNEAHFRVVERIAPPGELAGEYGVECLEDREDLWGINFPSSEPVEGAEAKALLECRMCRRVVLHPLTLSEVETLRMIGVIGRPCRRCGTVTPSAYAEVRLPLNPATAMARVLNEAYPDWVTAVAETLERGYRRVHMQLPIGVRDWSGAVDVTRTENTSRTGLCFTSARTYLPGEIVAVAYPVDPTLQVELSARIVREQPIQGTGRKIYGATFEGPPHFISPRLD